MVMYTRKYALLFNCGRGLQSYHKIAVLTAHNSIANCFDSPLADTSDVVANTDTSLSSVPSINCGHTFTVVVTPSVAFTAAPRGKPITTTRYHEEELNKHIII